MDLFDAVNANAMHQQDDIVTHDIEQLTHAARAISTAGYLVGHLDNDEYEGILETLAGLMADLLAIEGVNENYIAIAHGEFQTAMFHQALNGDDPGISLEDILGPDFDLDDLDFEDDDQN